MYAYVHTHKFTSYKYSHTETIRKCCVVAMCWWEKNDMDLWVGAKKYWEKSLNPIFLNVKRAINNKLKWQFALWILYLISE